MVSLRLILRSIAKRYVSKDGAAAWFETRCFAALLTMRPEEEKRECPAALVVRSTG